MESTHWGLGVCWVGAGLPADLWAVSPPPRSWRDFASRSCECEVNAGNLRKDLQAQGGNCCRPQLYVNACADGATVAAVRPGKTVALRVVIRLLEGKTGFV